MSLEIYSVYTSVPRRYISLEQSSLISLITYWPPVKPFKVIIGEWAYDCVCVCVCVCVERQMMLSRVFMRMGSLWECVTWTKKH